MKSMEPNPNGISETRNIILNVGKIKKMNSIIVHVIWKFRMDLPIVSTFLILSFLITQIANGIIVPSNGNAKNPNWDKLSTVSIFLSSCTLHSITSSGDTFNATANLLRVSPRGTDSPFSIRWIVLRLNPVLSASSSWDSPCLILKSFTLFVILNFPSFVNFKLLSKSILSQ